VSLPFTPEQFFGVFAEYNNALWPAVVGFWLASLGVLGATWRKPTSHSWALTYVLAALWAWNAVAYHVWFFTKINPAAWLFGAAFAFQAALFLWAGARLGIDYFSSDGVMGRVGASLVIYALAYPFLTMAFGHRYPAAPTFGVPCPTVILTIGLLLTARGGIPPLLAIVPVLWGFIGGSAAVLLNVPTDYVLLGAGLLLALAVMTSRRTPVPASGDATHP
jgi:Family of unknown function (DUF6064)